METYTTTDDGRTIELEIVQNAPVGYAVNFHQMDECVGRIYFDDGGFRVTSGNLAMFADGEENELGHADDRFAALQIVVEYLAKYLDMEETGTPHDPADADELLTDLLDPEVYGDYYSPAARRDILRRAAYDLAITDRRAHKSMLPVIARKAADMIREEMEPTLRKVLKSDVAEILEVFGWSADHRKTSYEHGTAGSFTMTIDAESIKVYAARPASTVETFTFDRDRTSAERLARVILAVFED